MTCKELTELVTDYLEGRQSFLDRARFELHVGMCRHCRAHLRQMKHTVQVLGSLPEETIRQEISNELLERFRNWHR